MLPPDPALALTLYWLALKLALTEQAWVIGPVV
jgi:hypothetical protein